MQPLPSGLRDPLCRTEMPPMTEHQLDAWRHTVQHLWAHGLPARFPADVCRRLDEYVHHRSAR
jgi:hypothetical protein